MPYEIKEPHILNVYAGLATPQWIRLLDNEIEDTEEEDNQLFIEKESIRDIGSLLFNNSVYSDLSLRLTDGVIYVHKLILRTYCEHFKSMLDGLWAENDKDEIDMTRYNPQAYRAFVKYIYTGKLEQSITEAELVELCDIAESYFEDDLKRMVIARLTTSITIGNVAELYCAACSQHCEDIKEMCSDFVSNHLEKVILTEGFDKLKGDLCKSLITRAVQIKHNQED